MGRFQVIEHRSHFAIRDQQTGEERPLGDGVDTFFDVDGKPVPPGTDGFCEKWAEAFNADEAETLEVFFPEHLGKDSES